MGDGAADEVDTDDCGEGRLTAQPLTTQIIPTAANEGRNTEE
jgi:hypothetical protein